MGAFRRNKGPSAEAPNVNDVHTVLGPESSFEGKLSFEGTVRIDGRFVGEVHTDNLLIVGPSARLEATLYVGSVIIHGEVVGDVMARHWVEIHAPGKLYGDVHSPELMIDRGVLFQGNSSMEAAASTPKVAAAASHGNPTPVAFLKSADAGLNS
jgi:cytoskeletal protein CcmA (bactofilin family)